MGGRVDKEEGAAARAACASMPEVDDEGGIAGRGRARCAGVGGRARTALTRTTHADDEKRVSLSSPVCAHSLLSRLKRARTHARSRTHSFSLSLTLDGYRRRPHLRRPGRQPHRAARVGAEPGKEERASAERAAAATAAKHIGDTPPCTPGRARSVASRVANAKLAACNTRLCVGTGGVREGGTCPNWQQTRQHARALPPLCSIFLTSQLFFTHTPRPLPNPLRNARPSSATWTPRPRKPWSGKSSPRPAPSRPSTSPRTGSRASTRGTALSSSSRRRTRTTRRACSTWCDCTVNRCG